MLRETIGEIKRTRSEELFEKIGGCKFCGQIASLEVPEEWKGEMCDELATEMCDCIESTIYTHKKSQKERANKAIETQFGIDSKHPAEEVVKELLYEVANMIVEEQIRSATLDIGGGVKAKVTMTSKGNVKVEKTVTEKTTNEA